MMQRIQSLFNALIGIQHNEAMLLVQAKMIFERPGIHHKSLEVPAYRRRPKRVGVPAR